MYVCLTLSLSLSLCVEREGELTWYRKVITFFKFIFRPRKGKGKHLKDFYDAEKQGMLHGKCDKVYNRYSHSFAQRF